MPWNQQLGITDSSHMRGVSSLILYPKGCVFQPNKKDVVVLMSACLKHCSALEYNIGVHPTRGLAVL